MKPCVVLDKNFLQGAPAADIHQAYETHDFVMPGALFFELLTTETDSRIKCFSKLPQIDNPVHLVEHMGLLLRSESNSRLPCGLPSSHRIKINFQFNALLWDPSYVFPNEVRLTIEDQTLEAQADVMGLVNLSETVPSLFPDLARPIATKGSPAHKASELLIANASAVREFYEALESPRPEHSYPQIVGAPEQWAHIRHLQVKMLFATDLYVRYRGKLRSMLTPNVLTKLEHDVHDAQILSLAVLEGAIATREKKLVQWFQLLAPHGTVLPRGDA